MPQTSAEKRTEAKPLRGGSDHPTRSKAMRKQTTPCGNTGSLGIGQGRLEPGAKTLEETSNPESGGTASGAVAGQIGPIDPDLRQIIVSVESDESFGVVGDQALGVGFMPSLDQAHAHQPVGRLEQIERNKVVRLDE